MSNFSWHTDANGFKWLIWLMQPDKEVTIMTDLETQEAVERADADLAALDANEAPAQDEQPKAEEAKENGEGTGEVSDSGAGEDQAEAQPEDAVADQG